MFAAQHLVGRLTQPVRRNTNISAAVTSLIQDSGVFVNPATTSATPTTAQVRCATKKAGGSSNNGRDSIGRRLGIKVYPGVYAKAGNIIIRQRGRKFHSGENVVMGRDHTISAKVSGIVKFTRHPTNNRNVVHIIPEESA
mmetsp:Transcript_28400/g.39915  ORF Transcript_28400/g.39915 Transcript_28400/m.39915 type:complete len:140 (+) Transcript_28400:136-555(+)